MISIEEILLRHSQSHQHVSSIEGDEMDDLWVGLSIGGAEAVEFVKKLHAAGLQRWMRSVLSSSRFWMLLGGLG